MGDHRPANATSPRRLGGVHGFQFRVQSVQSLQRPDGEQFTIGTETEERDRRIEKASHVQSEDVLRRAGRPGEREMSFEQFANVAGARIVNRDFPVRHAASLTRAS